MSAHNKKLPKISVILPVYNGADNIVACIESLLNQTYINKEIIVVNDGSTDDTHEIVKRYPVKLITINHSGRSRARNVGLREATGELIVFVEDDAVYSPLYLEFLVKYFECSSVGGAIGPYYVLNPNSFLTKCKEIERRVHFSNYKPFTGWIYRRKVLEEIGAFDEKLEYAEDIDVGLRVQKAGYKIVFEPKAVWFHKEPDSLFAFLKRRFIGGRGIVPYILKHKLPIFPHNMLLLPIGFMFLLMILILMPERLVIWISVFLFFLLIIRLRWIIKAARITRNPVYCLGWIFIEYLGWAATFLGIIFGRLRSRSNFAHRA